MCGIMGIVQRGHRIDRDAIVRARDVVTYRGPDGAGFWETRAGDAHVALGHRRLSIIDLSSAGLQPMVLSPNGRSRPAEEHDDGLFSLTYNGEIYNYLELRDELRSLGHRFVSESDTEVLLTAYAQWGPACVDRLNGMYAFAVWDARRRCLFCARDRFGEKPFHFVVDDNRQVFAFASEIKTLMAMGVAEPEFDDRALYRYFAFGEQAGVPQTIWRGVQRLPAAHALEVHVDVGKLDVRTYRYWDVDPHDTLELDEAAAKRSFSELFRSSVSLRLRSDVPVGTSLSGGLDSSSVLCQIRELGTLHGQKAFTARMEDERIDESGIVATLLSEVGIPGYVVTPSAAAFLEHADRLFFHQEEPYPSTSMFASYLVHGLAKEHDVTVLLDGQGADEYLAGYPHYPALILSSLAARGRLLRWWKERNALRSRVGADPVPWRAATSFALGSLLDGTRSLVVDQPRDTSHLSKDYRDRFAEEAPRSIAVGRSPLKTRLYADLMLGHLQELLRYTDRNSMAHSREVRLPFLDHRLVQFCLRLPERFLYRDGTSKWILRESMRDIMPARIVDRRDKVGFATPWAQWWSDAVAGPILREWLGDAHQALRPWLAPTLPAEGSPAALEILALASMRRSLRESSEGVHGAPAGVSAP